MRVLIIDDDPALGANLSRWLAASGIDIDVACTAADGLRAAVSSPHEVVVLDVMLDGPTSGFDVCAELRRSGLATPVIMLTARDAVPDRVRGLEAGADDYLVKPFALQELEARVRALARRHLVDRTAVLRLGDLELDTRTRAATAAGRTLALTEKETRLLEFLLLNRAAPQSQEAILASVWGRAPASSSNLVDVYVGRIRRKLAAAGSPVAVAAHRRQGYRLEAGAADPPPGAS